MLVNKANLEKLFTDLHTEFANAFAVAPSTWQKIAVKVPSTGEGNFYAWLSSFPKMRRWTGPKHIKNLDALNHDVKNLDFEATVEIQRNHVEDDQTGMYLVQAQSAGYAAAQLPDDLVYEAVNNGFGVRCYDGQYFFDTDHPVAGASVSNMSTKPLSVENLTGAKAGYGAARIAMRGFKDEEGRSLNITPSVLLVGVALEDNARLLLTNDKLADGTPNPYKGTAELVVDARIESDTAWYLLDTTRPMKPFVYQERKSPEFVSQTSMAAADVFSLKVYKFGAEARAAAGYGHWQMAFGSTGTGL